MNAGKSISWQAAAVTAATLLGGALPRSMGSRQGWRAVNQRRDRGWLGHCRQLARSSTPLPSRV